MAGDAEAEGQVDIIGHILDSKQLDVPIVNAHNWVDGHINLPQFPPIYGIDLSISKHVLVMWVASALLILLLTVAFRRPQAVPFGLASLFEAIVLFVRDEVVLPIMGEDGRKFLPYLLTVFFFILFCNLIGLFPPPRPATSVSPPLWLSVPSPSRR